MVKPKFNLGTNTLISPNIGTLTGNVTGDVTGNVTGNVTGDVTGNADTATLAAGLSFGSANQIVFKNSSNTAVTSSNLGAFDGASITVAGDIAPSNTRLLEVTAVLELFLNTIWFADPKLKPAASVAVSAFPVTSPVTFSVTLPVTSPVTLPVKVPVILGEIKVLVPRLNLNALSVKPVIIVPVNTSVRTIRCSPVAEISLIVAPVLVKFAPSPKNEAAVIEPNPTISGVFNPTISPPIYSFQYQHHLE